MSEGKSRFRIKKGDIEIEFEGDPKEGSIKYKEAFEWMKSLPITPVEVKPSRKKEKEEKEERRGGARSWVVSPEVDRLIEEGWFSEFRKIPDVIEELTRRTVPGVKRDTVLNALNRRVKSGKLDRVKDTDGRWTYGVKS